MPVDLLKVTRYYLAPGLRRSGIPKQSAGFFTVVERNGKVQQGLSQVNSVRKRGKFAQKSRQILLQIICGPYLREPPLPRICRNVEVPHAS